MVVHRIPIGLSLGAISKRFGRPGSCWLTHAPMVRLRWDLGQPGICNHLLPNDAHVLSDDACRDGAAMSYAPLVRRFAEPQQRAVSQFIEKARFSFFGLFEESQVGLGTHSFGFCRQRRAQIH